MYHAVPLTVTALTKAFCKQQLPYVSHHNSEQRVNCQYDTTISIIRNGNLISWVFNNDNVIIHRRGCYKFQIPLFSFYLFSLFLRIECRNRVLSFAVVR